MERLRQERERELEEMRQARQRQMETDEVTKDSLFLVRK